MKNITLKEAMPKVDYDDDFVSGIVTQLNVNKLDRCIEAYVTFSKLINQERINEYRKKAVLMYKLSNFYLFPTFDVKEDTVSPKIAFKNALDSFSSKNPFLGALLTDCDFSFEEDTVVVSVKHGNVSVLLQDKADKSIEAEYFERTKKNVKVVFSDDLEEYSKELPKMEVKTVSKKDVPKGENVIVGKEFSDSLMIKISDIDELVGNCVVAGKIFSVELKENIKRKTDNKKFSILSFDITDYTSSISCKAFLPPAVASEAYEELKNSKSVSVHGKVSFDNFKHSLVISVKDIMKYSIPKPTDDAPQKRVELHAHTKLSAMDAVIEVKDLVEQAVNFGHKAIAITDHGVVQSFPDAAKKKKELKSDIKIIYGVEGYLLDDKYEYNDKASKTNHIIILAKNQKGLFNLYNLISLSHLNYFYKRPRLPRREIVKFREGLIIGSACEQGELYQAILTNKSEEELESIASFYDYLEIQPLSNNSFMLREKIVPDEDRLIEINKKIVELGKKLNKPVVATCDVHFLNERDGIYRKILLAGQGYQDTDYQPPLYFRTTDEMLKEFMYLGEETAREVVIENSNLIADMIDDLRPVPPDPCPPEIEGSEETIKTISHDNAVKLYGEPLPEIVEHRLTRELNAVVGNGYAVMYNIARLLVEKSLSDGYLVGSRGSVGSSFLAYLSNITEVNSLPPHYRCEKCHYSEFITDGSYSSGCDMPEKNCPNCSAPLIRDGHDIPFETFLGFEGDKQPDIDLNFSGEYQQTAHKYVEELFGTGYVFKAGTVSTLADKTAFGYVKGYITDKGMDVPPAEIERLKNGCMNIKKTTGQHPGGIIVLPKGHDIHEFTPVQRPADDTTSDIITTHFDYHSIDQNLLKLDILGHEGPTMIRMLEDLTGVVASKIPMNDPGVMGLFVGTETLGVSKEDIDSEVGTFAVPEFGTKFVRQMLLDTKPTTFAELVRISGLSHGTDVWTNNAQDLIQKNICTLKNAICTRDDIMLYLIQMGLPPKDSFTIMERVRKGKKLTPENEALMREHSIPEWYINSCNKIQYMFPKAHAVAYVIMSLRIAYFKVHYPLEFYLTYFSVRGIKNFDYDVITGGKRRVVEKIKELSSLDSPSANDKDLLSILEVTNEMYARNISFLPVDIYKSHPTKFLAEEGKIRPALTSIPGLGSSAAFGIEKARNDGDFISVEDFKNRSGVSKTMVETFSSLGCFDGWQKTNQLNLLDM